MVCLWYMQQAQARWHAGLFTSDDDAKRKSSPAGNPHQTFSIRSMEKPEILLEKEKQKRTDEAGTLPEGLYLCSSEYFSAAEPY